MERNGYQNNLTMFLKLHDALGKTSINSLVPFREDVLGDTCTWRYEHATTFPCSSFPCFSFLPRGW